MYVYYYMTYEKAVSGGGVERWGAGTNPPPRRELKIPTRSVWSYTKKLGVY